MSHKCQGEVVPSEPDRGYLISCTGCGRQTEVWKTQAEAQDEWVAIMRDVERARKVLESESDGMKKVEHWVCPLCERMNSTPKRAKECCDHLREWAARFQDCRPGDPILLKLGSWMGRQHEGILLFEKIMFSKSYGGEYQLHTQNSGTYWTHMSYGKDDSEYPRPATPEDVERVREAMLKMYEKKFKEITDKLRTSTKLVLEREFNW